MADAIKSFVFIPAIVAALSYSYFLSSKLPKGIYRFISLLPTFYLLTILPLTLSSTYFTTVAAFCLTWLANFKLLLFAFGLGPLHPPKSLIHFIAITSLPVKIKSNLNLKKKSPLINLQVELFIFPLLTNFLCEHKQSLSPYVLLIIHCSLIFMMVDLLVFVSNAVTRLVVGLELEQPSDEPYLATSVQDFWGRRWNLMVTNILRDAVYLPVMSVLPAKEWAKVPAGMATFVVSGLMHEVLLYYVTRATPTGEMTLFFVVHGMWMVVEQRVKRALAGRWELPRVVARLLTMVFMGVTSYWLFFPPLIRNGYDVKVFGEYQYLVGYLKTMFKP